MLYDIRPAYYEKFLAALTDDSGSLSTEPRFNQQVNNKGKGIIDGQIHQLAYRVIIETKKDQLENRSKLLKYADSFASGETKFLVHLSKNTFDQASIDEIESFLREKCKDEDATFHSLTFQDLADGLEALIDDYPYDEQLRNLAESFERYLIVSKLVRKNAHILRAMACGQSFKYNVKHQLYFDDATRGYRQFDYIGIYKNKAVRYIGKVENMIEADLDSEGRLEVKNSAEEATENQKERLITVIEDLQNLGWDISKGIRFFLLKDFHETLFKKTSPGGIFRVRYFNLEQRFDEVPSDVESIADGLKRQTWS